MHQHAIDTICDIEKQLDTQSFLYGGVNYWPLCRLRLWSHLISSALKSQSSTASTISNSGPTFADVGQVNAFPFGDPTLGFVHTDKITSARIEQDCLQNPDLLFFVRPEEYRDQVDGRAFAKMLDSLYDRASAYNRLKIELSNPQTMTMKRYNDSAFLHPQLILKSAKFDPPYKPENFAPLADALDQIKCGTLLTAESVATDMGKIFYHARILEVVLNGLKPKAIFLSVYYHPIGMALMLAARRLSITTIDLQHGRLGPHHGLYTQLTAAPPSGYDLLPDHVWCWGAQTKHDIDVDKARNCKRHGGLVGGNPWLDRWLNSDVNDVNHTLPTLSKEPGEQKRILLSLQPIEAPLPSFVIEAMSQGPQDWEWWIRLHPLRRHTAPELADLLRSHGIENYNLTDATDLPLFALLKTCNHHVTAFSSVAMEALAFNLRTTLWTDTGCQIFAKHLASGIFNAAFTASGLTAAIQASFLAPPPQEAEPFIDTRSGLAETVLAEILSNSHDTLEALS